MVDGESNNVVETEGPGLKVKRADRTKDKLFRIVMENHLQLSAMADRKANMMITVCALILTLSLWRIDAPELRATVFTLSLTCITTIILAVYATLPRLPQRLRGQVKPSGAGFNVIFFGYFTQLDFSAYMREMERVVNDRNAVYDSLSRDLYSLGKILSGRKYKYIRISYQVFMAGLVTSIVVLAVTALLGHSSN